MKSVGPLHKSEAAPPGQDVVAIHLRAGGVQLVADSEAPGRGLLTVARILFPSIWRARRLDFSITNRSLKHRKAVPQVTFSGFFNKLPRGSTALVNPGLSF